MAALPAVLISLGMGCYRASGVQRPSLVAEKIPAGGVEKVTGLKAEGAPGDYYLCSDRLQLVVDGTTQGKAVAGAPGGGSIIDFCQVALNQASFHRVSMPADSLERLSTVFNQDPDITFVMDSCMPYYDENLSRLDMVGHIHDPKGKLKKSRAALAKVEVRQSVSLGKDDKFITLTTTVVNNSGAILPIRNIGDLVFQKAGLLRFNIPAQVPSSRSGETWGVQIPGNFASGKDAAEPLTRSVKSEMVAMMGVEPAGNTEDIHSSYGIMPVKPSAMVVVNCDKQDALQSVRPEFPQRMVAGSEPQPQGLLDGASLSYVRRLYVISGASSQENTPSQATGIFNQMALDRTVLNPSGPVLGKFVFEPVGTARRMGPYPSEFRIERAVGNTWKLERTEWFEPFDTNGPSNFQVMLPEGTYRMSIQNAVQGSLVMDKFVDANPLNVAGNAGPSALTIKKYNYNQESLDNPIGNAFKSDPAKDVICPEKKKILGKGGTPITSLYTLHEFTSRPLGGSVNSIQPMRLEIKGRAGSSDPSLKRVRILNSIYNPDFNGPMAKIGSESDGVFGFQAGNSFFGASSPKRKPVTLCLPDGSYTVMAGRGPLAPIYEKNVSGAEGHSEYKHTFAMRHSPMPAGWVSFDIPGPSLATTGGMLPLEKLSSALAEGVQVVGMTEMDRHVDYTPLAKDFHAELNGRGQTEDDLKVIGSEPFVFRARTTKLKNTGDITALFVQEPRFERNGGARPSDNWTQGEFKLQAEGDFSIQHWNRDENGKFIVPSLDSKLDFIELLRGEGCQRLDEWFNAFLDMRKAWYNLLKNQQPNQYTKALGLSSGKFSLDTPVGLARTYIRAAGVSQDNLDSVKEALAKGAAVASTGPLLDVRLKSGRSVAGFGETLNRQGGTLLLEVDLWAADWVPVEELRVIINGNIDAPRIFNLADPKVIESSKTGADKRMRRYQLSIDNFPQDKDAFIVVEAGVPLKSSPKLTRKWEVMMKGIYPIAVTNPIFVKGKRGSDFFDWR